MAGREERHRLEKLRSVDRRHRIPSGVRQVTGREDYATLAAAAALAAVLPLSSFTGVADLVLVRDGVSLALITILKDAPPYTRRAADELAEYIKKANVIEREHKLSGDYGSGATCVGPPVLLSCLLAL